MITKPFIRNYAWWRTSRTAVSFRQSSTTSQFFPLLNT